MLRFFQQQSHGSLSTYQESEIPTLPAILAAAEMEIGKRYAGPVIGELDSYRWGNPGWDCSSFVSGVVQKVFGVRLTAFTDSAYGETVAVAEPVPGDIVFYRYNDSSQPGVRYPHMGFWVDKNTVLDARFPDGVNYHPHITKGTMEIRRVKARTLPDMTGYDLLPLIYAASQKYSIPSVALLAMIKAESNLNPYAARYGLWPDVSFGLIQMTVQTAAGYGIGDGTRSDENIAAVRTELFKRLTAIMLGAQHLAGNFAYVRLRRPELAGDELNLMALRVYNGGGGAITEEWARQHAGHITAYRIALEWAHAALGE